MAAPRAVRRAPGATRATRPPRWSAGSAPRRSTTAWQRRCRRATRVRFVRADRAAERPPSGSEWSSSLCSGRAQQGARRRQNHRRRNRGQTAKVTRHAVPLMARTARQWAGVDGDRADGRIAPRHRALGQGWAEQRDDRRVRGGGHVQRTAVAADVERGAADERGELGEIEFTGAHDSGSRTHRRATAPPGRRLRRRRLRMDPR